MDKDKKGGIANLSTDCLFIITIKYSEPEKTMGPSGVIPIAVLKAESTIVEISVLVFSYYY